MTEPLQQRWSAALMNNYGTPKLALTHGEGPYVFDADGTRYLDLLGGIAVNSLGHAHPAVVSAVTEQIATLGHVSNLYINPRVVELAEALLDKFGQPGRAFFCNSGTEANEAAFKLARRTGRPEIVAAEAAFHGRTMGALAMTGQPSKREPFEPMPPGVRFVPYGDAAALDAAVTDRTAAVILEPILGESGVVVPPVDYLATARRITAERGALLILDEVQTGIARTGSFFAHQAAGVVPDVMTLAKGLGGGMPIGACLATGPAADLFTPGQHGTTFGGNPVAAAAALAVIRTIDNEGLTEHVAAVGKSIAGGIDDLEHPLVSHVRGAGLLLGIVLNRPVSATVEAEARAAGFLINAPAPDVIRLAPPLIITEEQGRDFVNALPGILDSAAKEQA
ncbi:acetylornithine and succinylornithine aminotransferase [Gordonia bronchialis DSM 43247]|uniref:Acetylornithine aminotransferase n=1 Tax=Gordonia bronchialis (strain ATCC 25592 / DSM 43247 / BCRC 13721 / JCM 3198 / KCTC 3076 / NBRC 16047 / NCTC 10667) TaxID=526226 RepID=D0L961_GORB4|nr:acetylornithine transaminase [Gordonia bronchialis]ACY22052.1 acetylornithine and succinylornithine aminotransferase [Gordonia bronchialis DSM 43247]MCC3324844.1 acetylornithine transaminase [Gordonia bronchialis]QGS24382.1 acetylornithine transaminase [Gordonia bronchialis]UAK39323.1 acetylornithine transaminase [Gordonia bronchialis]STQ64967.1 Acetylornithine aminotransferase [Gordonia bronchialis]